MDYGGCTTFAEACIVVEQLIRVFVSSLCY